MSAPAYTELLCVDISGTAIFAGHLETIHMKAATLYSTEAPAGDVTLPSDFLPLHLETRTHVTTAVMCRHLGRREQTARGWASRENGPLRPTRVHRRLAWSVADIRRLLGVA